MLDGFGRLADAVLTLGYGGIWLALVVEALGLPFPGDAALVFYGFAAARGDLNWGLAFAASVIGYLTGALVSYVTGRRLGERWEQVPVRHAVWLDGARLRQAAGRLLRYGPLLLVPGRFLPGWRAVSSYAAGAARMDLRAFLVYTGTGAGLWCGAWLGVGYWFGENADWLLQTANKWLAGLAAAGTAAVAGLWLYRRTRPD